MANQSDFLDVKLSAAGAKLAGTGGSVHISNVHLAYRFTADASTRVLTSEWERFLALETVDGEPLLVLSTGNPEEPEPEITVAQAAEEDK